MCAAIDCALSMCIRQYERCQQHRARKEIASRICELDMYIHARNIAASDRLLYKKNETLYTTTWRTIATLPITGVHYIYISICGAFVLGKAISI